MATEITKSFIGTGWSFPPTFTKSDNSVQMVSGAEDIKQSLQILLSTKLGERVMQPQYGSMLEQLLFEPINTSFKSYINDTLKDAIFYHESRIEPLDVLFEAIPEEGKVEVTIEYMIRENNTRTNAVFPFYLKEGINI